jgi:hypothetical protein
MKRFVVISDFGDKEITSESGSGVPGRLLFLLTEFELGFEFEVALKLDGTETASSDIIFEYLMELIKL